MRPFSSIYPQTDREVRAILAQLQCPTPQRVGQLLSESRSRTLDLPEVAELLEIGSAPDAGDQFEQLRSFTFSAWRRPAANQVRYVAPIYVSSFCVDTCGYCNFSANRKTTERKRLSLDELDTEIAFVMEQGARVIELVFGTDPEVHTDHLVAYIRRTLDALRGEPGSGVLLCTEYLSPEIYRTLRDAGLSGIVQWDETLDSTEYHRWHDASPRKREFQLRMDNHDSAMAAGLDVATGALFGLTDYRYDALLQIAKARHFAAQYGRRPFVFGTARLKPIGGRELHLKTSMSDRAYETTLMVYKVAEPTVGRWLQTRESFDMNLASLLDNDVFTYRCGDVTPGGYHQIEGTSNTKAGQFGVNELDRDYVARELASRHFRMNFRWLNDTRAKVAA